MQSSDYEHSSPPSPCSNFYSLCKVKKRFLTQLAVLPLLLLTFQTVLGLGVLDGIGAGRLVDFSQTFSKTLKEYKVFDQLTKELKLSASTIVKLVDLVAYFLDLALGPSPPVPYFDPEEWWGDESEKNNHDETIRPFHVEFNDSMISDLRKRLDLTRPLLPALKGENIGQNYGSHSQLVEQVLNYWSNEYDFKKREEYLNQYDHYKTHIQGLEIHYVHVYPKNPGNKKVIPVLLVHGGQTSFREFFDVVPYLTTPREDYDFVFEAIIPSLPGHGYSQATSKVGLGFHRMAVIMRNLMQRLGYKQYYLQAGDWGHAVSTAISVLYPDDVLGFHSNFPISFRLRTLVRYFLGSLDPPSVVEPQYEDRMYPLKDRVYYFLTQLGYFHMEATKPDTLAGIDQSPSGLLAYFLQNLVDFTNYDRKDKADGDLDEFIPYVDVIDTAMIYWVTKTAQSSFRLYAENLAFVQDPTIFDMIENQAKVPYGTLKFRYELFYLPDSFLEDKFPNLVHSNTLDFGGHFAGEENPEVLADDFFTATVKFMQFNEENNRYKA